MALLKSAVFLVLFQILSNSAFTITAPSSGSSTLLPNCTCVPFYQCSDDENGTIISDGRGLLEIRQTSEDQICANFFDVCCNTVVPAQSAKPSQSQSTPACGSADLKDFPWTASLLIKENEESAPVYRCGISLINKRVALTAAHCVYQEDTIYLVRIGNKIRRVAKKIPHPHFKKNSLHNDIAILILKTSFGGYVSSSSLIMCLPPPGSVFDESNCTVATGIGRIHKNDTEQHNLLKYLQLPIVPRNECTSALRETRLGKLFVLDQSFICAGGQLNKDACGGDGGSALVCPIPGLPRRYQQAGIVSWGIGCGEKLPGVYVNLALFRDWIDGVMLSNNLEINSYRY